MLDRAFCVLFGHSFSYHRGSGWFCIHCGKKAPS